MSVIPSFEYSGNLPSGRHLATWRTISSHFGKTPRRKQLLKGLWQALIVLQNAGCQVVYLDGSFVTNKEEPGDFDAFWHIAGVDPTLLDPVLLTFANGRAAQKARFGGELFPADLPEGMSGKTFLEFFQLDRISGEAKGIIVLNLKELPTINHIE